jgi:hypothetical protein
MSSSDVFEEKKTKFGKRHHVINFTELLIRLKFFKLGKIFTSKLIID